METRKAEAEPLINPAMFAESPGDYVAPSPQKISLEGMLPKIQTLVQALLEPGEYLIWWRNKTLGTSRFQQILHRLSYPFAIGGCVGTFFLSFLTFVTLVEAFAKQALFLFIPALLVSIGLLILGIMNLSVCYIITNRRAMALTPYMNPDAENLTHYRWDKAADYKIIEYPDNSGRGDIIFDLKQYKYAKDFAAFTNIADVREVQWLIIKIVEPKKPKAKKTKAAPITDKRPEAAWPTPSTSASTETPDTSGWPEPPLEN